MLKIDFEFRKGIFFIRLIGDMNSITSKSQGKEIKDLLTENKFKYIVINVNNLKTIDTEGINYINDIYNMIKTNQSNLVLCDKFKILNKLIKNNIPSIDDELEVL